MYPLIFQIHTYDILVTLGSILGVIVVMLLTFLKMKDIKITLVVSLSIIPMVILGSFIGRLILRLSAWDFAGIHGFMSKLEQYNGVHFIGTILVFAIFVPLIFKKVRKVERKSFNLDLSPVSKNKKLGYEIANILSFYLMIQHIFNRLACFCEGCCYGKEYNGWGSITYTQGYAFNVGIDYAVFPATLFEIICMMLLLILLIVLYRKGLSIFEITIIGLGSIIFVSEFFMNQRGKMLYMGMSFVQIASITVIIIGIIMLIKEKRCNKKNAPIA